MRNTPKRSIWLELVLTFYFFRATSS